MSSMLAGCGGVSCVSTVVVAPAGEAGLGAAVGGAVVSTELVALPAAVAEGQRKGRAVVDVVVAEFVARRASRICSSGAAGSRWGPFFP